MTPEEIPQNPEAASPARRRRVRADATRNIETLLQTAAEEFERHGIDLPMRELAGRAGVGVGTLYRHFPTRSDLIIAVYRKEVDECVAAVSTLTATCAPVEALLQWVRSYVDFILAHRGLAAALNAGDPALEGLPAYFQQQLRPPVQQLLDRAFVARDIGSKVTANELIHAIAMLCVPPHCGGFTDPHRMVGIFMNGLRNDGNVS